MNADYLSLLPADFDDRSRVWIYQSSRLFTMSEALHIEDLLTEFVSTWNSHGHPVKGYANLFFGQFIVLIADETATGVSGCSTDSSVRLIRQIERDTNVGLFDRITLAFLIREKVQLLPLVQLPAALESRLVTAGTIYFNNTVLTLSDLKTNWMIPVGKSWLNNDRRYHSLISKTVLAD